MDRRIRPALDGVVFRKSSYSDPDRECVEIGHAAAVFSVRDSKASPSPVLAVEAEQGRTFIDVVKSGWFNR